MALVVHTSFMLDALRAFVLVGTAAAIGSCSMPFMNAAGVIATSCQNEALKHLAFPSPNPGKVRQS